MKEQGPARQEARRCCGNGFLERDEFEDALRQAAANGKGKDRAEVRE